MKITTAKTNKTHVKMAESAGRPVYVQVNLDSITKNIQVIRSRYPENKKPGIIAVVKAGAYGHGSVLVSQHLKKIGVERLAVATLQEGIHLRNNDIQGPIHVFGNVLAEEMQTCVEYEMIPTLSHLEAITGLVEALRQCKKNIKGMERRYTDLPLGSVNIKVDTGMSRNGCQPEELPELVKRCDEEGIHIDAIFTHFADAWGNPDFTKEQLATFLETTKEYRALGIKTHVANSGAIFRGYGLDLDFVRPGITIYGLPPDDASPEFQDIGLKPIASVIGYPTLVKKLGQGRSVGYSCTYQTGKEEWVATLPIGYADGYWRHLSSKGVVIRNKTGERCPLVGRVSMDAITVLIPEQVALTESFTVISDDYDPQTSMSGIATNVGTIAYEVGTRLSCRFPRVYVKDKKEVNVSPLVPQIY